MKKQLIPAAALVWLCYAAPAQAQCPPLCSCGLLAGQQSLAVNNLIKSYWNCDASLWDQFRADFRIDHVASPGWSPFYSGICDMQQGLPRLMNGIWLLWNPGGGFLRSYDYVRNLAPDTWHPSCETTSASFSVGLFFYCTPPPTIPILCWRGNRLNVFKSGFELPTPVDIASALVHEARHMVDGPTHDSRACLRQPLDGPSACDSSWQYEGAYRYEVEWLADFTRLSWLPRGERVPFDLPESAARLANTTLEKAFVQRPGFRVVKYIGLVPLCFPNCPSPEPQGCGFCKGDECCDACTSRGCGAGTF